MALIDIDSPQVSIIMPVYNRKHLIERAIHSVEQQTLQSWELLIIDDGSTDGLEELIIPMLADFPKYRYFKHSHRKLAATRNIGIHAALGEFITFLDSDDEYKPQHLEIRIAYFDEHPNVDIIHGGVELIGTQDSFYVQDAFNSSKKIHISNCCIGATLFGRKEIFVKSGGFKKLDYSAESEFLPRIQKRYTVRKVNFPTYRYYTGLEDSICKTRMNREREK